MTDPHSTFDTFDPEDPRANRVKYGVRYVYDGEHVNRRPGKPCGHCRKPNQQPTYVVLQQYDPKTGERISWNGGGVNKYVDRRCATFLSGMEFDDDLEKIEESPY